MNVFRDIDALLRMIAREKEILKFLFTGRKAPSLRPEQALENFLEQDSRRLEYLLEHGVIRLADGVLVLEDTYLRFFEEVLEVNEEINVLSVKQHIDALNENIELWRYYDDSYSLDYALRDIWDKFIPYIRSGANSDAEITSLEESLAWIEKTEAFHNYGIPSLIPFRDLKNAKAFLER